MADYGLTLGDLIGTIETFFHRIGVTKLRFKPAYNPYTEPSMEIFGFSEGLNKWMELVMLCRVIAFPPLHIPLVFPPRCLYYPEDPT